MNEEVRPIGMKTDEICETCDSYMNATTNQNVVYCLICQKSQERKLR